MSSTWRIRNFFVRSGSGLSAAFHGCISSGSTRLYPLVRPVSCCSGITPARTRYFDRFRHNSTHPDTPNFQIWEQEAGNSNLPIWTTTTRGGTVTSVRPKCRVRTEIAGCPIAVTDLSGQRLVRRRRRNAGRPRCPPPQGGSPSIGRCRWLPGLEVEPAQRARQSGVGPDSVTHRREKRGIGKGARRRCRSVEEDPSKLLAFPSRRMRSRTYSLFYPEPPPTCSSTYDLSSSGSDTFIVDMASAHRIMAKLAKSSDQGHRRRNVDGQITHTIEQHVVVETFSEHPLGSHRVRRHQHRHLPPSLRRD